MLYFLILCNSYYFTFVSFSYFIYKFTFFIIFFFLVPTMNQHDEGLDHPNILIENHLVAYRYDIKMADLPDFIDKELKNYLDGHVAVVVSTSLNLSFFLFFLFFFF